MLNIKKCYDFKQNLFELVIKCFLWVYRNIKFISSIWFKLTLDIYIIIIYLLSYIQECEHQFFQLIINVLKIIFYVHSIFMSFTTFALKYIIYYLLTMSC